jgi:outer membrane immunogenic protein
VRKLIIAGAACLITVPAVAADLPVKAPLAPPSLAFSWTGLYIGGNAGYHWDRDRATTAADPVGWTVAGAAAIDAITPGTVRPRGFAGGVQAGYNWQMGTMLWGFEADVDWLDGRAARSVTGFGGGVNPLDVFTTAARDRLLATFRGRIGLVFDRSLVYVTGGLAVSDARFTDSFGSFGNTVIATTTTSSTRAGWTVGGGWEYAFFERWSAKFEYLYADFGRFNTSIPSCVGCAPGSDITVRHHFTENIARVGLNYRLGGP